jgi:hypothetical protein
MPGFARERSDTTGSVNCDDKELVKAWRLMIPEASVAGRGHATLSAW